MVELSIKTMPEHLKRVNAALTLRDIPDYKAALEQLEKAVELAPTDASIHLLLGLTYQDLENLEMAADSFRQALSLDPNSNEARQSFGLLLVQQEEYQEALDILRPIAENDVHNLSVILAYASALAQVGEKAKAIEILQAAHDDFPEDIDLARQSGRLLLEGDQFEPGIEFLAQALDSSAIVEIICSLAEEYIKDKHFERALGLLERAIEVYPDHDCIWRNMADSYLGLNNLDQALAAANKALDLNNLSLPNWGAKAQILIDLGRKDEAVNAFQRVIKLVNEVPPEQYDLGISLLILHLAKLLEKHGDYQAAIDCFEQGRQMLSNKPAIKLLTLFEGKTLIRVGQYKQALDTMQELGEEEELSKRFPDEYFHIYHGLNRPADALAVLQSVLDRKKVNKENFDPENAWKEFLAREFPLSEMEAIGENFYQKGRPQTAKLIFEQILSVAPDRTSTKDKLDLILANENQ